MATTDRELQMDRLRRISALHSKLMDEFPTARETELAIIYPGMHRERRVRIVAQERVDREIVIEGSRQ